MAFWYSTLRWWNSLNWECNALSHTEKTCLPLSTEKHPEYACMLVVTDFLLMLLKFLSLYLVKMMMTTDQDVCILTICLTKSMWSNLKLTMEKPKSCHSVWAPWNSCQNPAEGARRVLSNNFETSLPVPCPSRVYFLGRHCHEAAFGTENTNVSVLNQIESPS